VEAWVVVLHGGDAGRRYALGGPRLTIGRGADNAVALAAAGVERYHAAILRHGARYTLVDLGAARPTEVAGYALAPGEHYPLWHGDTIRLGDEAALRFHQPAANPEAQPTMRLPVTAPAAELTTRLPTTPPAVGDDDPTQRFRAARPPWWARLWPGRVRPRRR
jgi:pSer/pThr/pTyr-binding forkhead associated (FHA) protein